MDIWYGSHTRDGISITRIGNIKKLVITKIKYYYMLFLVITFYFSSLGGQVAV